MSERKSVENLAKPFISAPKESGYKINGEQIPPQLEYILDFPPYFPSELVNSLPDRSKPEDKWLNNCDKLYENIDNALVHTRSAQRRFQLPQ